MPQPNRLVQQNRLLGAISQEEIDRFFSDLHPVSLSLRQVLYQVGTPLGFVYFLEEGVVSVLTTMTNGAMVEAGMIGREGMVGLPALLGNALSGHHVIVQAPGTALRMEVAECRAAFEQSVAVRAILLRYTGMFLDVATQTAACNRLHTVKERFARWLLMMHDRLQSESMPLTHEFLSFMLSVRRTGVTEIAGDLQRTGLIRYRRGSVTILNHDGLAATACECYRDHDRLLH